jgi:hypothetical protein
MVFLSTLHSYALHCDPMAAWKSDDARRRNIYYKVQIFDSVSLTWVDEPSAFDELKAANKYVVEMLAAKQTRIMVVDGKRRYPLKQ